MNGTLYLSSNANQPKGHIESLSSKFRFMKSYGAPSLTLVTTSNVNIAKSVTKKAIEQKVNLIHLVSYYTITNNQMIITFGPKPSVSVLNQATKQ